MELVIERGPERRRELRAMPAATYNLARTLQSRSNGAVAFVPIRGMQVLAILDAEEFVFVDAERPGCALLAWAEFHPGERSSLDEPVHYAALYYEDGADDAARRLPGEFQRALEAASQRQRGRGRSGVILPLGPRLRE